MGREIEIRRHSIKDGAKHGTIGSKGYALARAVGEQQLRGKRFNAYFASNLWRTHQTLAAFDEGAGDFAIYLTPKQPDIYLSWPELPTLWRGCHAASERGEDMVLAALDLNRDLAERVAAEGARLFREWTSALPENAKALLVGHSPYLELICFGMHNVVIPGLKECQGFRLYPNENHRVEYDAPDLDPSKIRSELFPT